MSEVGRPTTTMDIVEGVLQAFATGTFIYVTFFEIFQEEIDANDTSIGKVSSALAGFIVVSLLVLIPTASTSDPTSEDNSTIPLQTGKSVLAQAI